MTMVKLNSFYDSFWTKGRKSKSIKTITVFAGGDEYFRPTRLPVPSCWTIKMFKCYVLQNVIRLHCGDPDRHYNFWKGNTDEKIENNSKTVGGFFGDELCHTITVSSAYVNVADPCLSPILEASTWTPSQANFPRLDGDESETSESEDEGVINEPEPEVIEPEAEDVVNEKTDEPDIPKKSIIVKFDTGKEMFYDPEQTVLAFKKQCMNHFGITPTRTALKRMNFYYGDDPLQKNANKCKNILTAVGRDVRMIWGGRGGGTRPTNKGNLYTKKVFMLGEKKQKVDEMSNDVKIPKIEKIEDYQSVISETIEMGKAVMKDSDNAFKMLAQKVPKDELRTLCEFSTPKADLRMTQICHLLMKHNAPKLMEMAEAIGTILASTTSAVEYAVSSNFLGDDGHWKWKKMEAFVEKEVEFRDRASSASSSQMPVAPSVSAYNPPVAVPPAPFSKGGNMDEDL